MEKTKSPLLFLTNTEGVMTTNISGHRSWQKVEQNWTDLKINKEKFYASEHSPFTCIGASPEKKTSCI